MNEDTFFTVIGCMDGRCVDPVKAFGRQEFNAEYADTITEPGLVGILTNNPKEEFLDNLKAKILISIQKHNSKGIVIDGHAECAGDPVDDEVQKDQVRKSVSIIGKLIGDIVPVVGIFVHRCPEHYKEWEAEKLPQTMTA